jgi:hypothetical protein
MSLTAQDLLMLLSFLVARGSLCGEALCYGLKVTGSSPYEVIVFLDLPNPYSRTIAPELTQSLTEMSTRSLPVGSLLVFGNKDYLFLLGPPESVSP